jgi:hypothetical protein
LILSRRMYLWEEEGEGRGGRRERREERERRRG